MTLKINKSIELFQKAQSLKPGGVDSPVRAFNAVGGQPLFIDRAKGPYLFDIDGNSFIDYVLSWGPLILGHAHPEVVSALKEAAENGTSYGAPSPLDIKLAELIQELMPNIEMLRFVNSGTEATMSALRLARAFTKRNKIIKFEGCYHGHADLLLVQAGSGVATLGLPDSPGVPATTVQDTLVAQFNQIESVASFFSKYPQEIAAVIVEPVAGNMGVIPPAKGFLEELREITQKNDALLIFDEVMTGFRVHLGGAQTLFDIKPDLTTLGKVIGGGLPVGAYGGRKDIMRMMAPCGPVYQAGTLSGNPLAMTAGISTLNALKKPGLWQQMESAVDTIISGIREAAQAKGIAIQQNRVGTMFATFFAHNPVTDWETAKESNTDLFGDFFQGMLERGIYLPPSQFETNFMSSAHDTTTVSATVEAAMETFKQL